MLDLIVVRDHERDGEVEAREHAIAGLRADEPNDRILRSLGRFDRQALAASDRIAGEIGCRQLPRHSCRLRNLRRGPGSCGLLRPHRARQLRLAEVQVDLDVVHLQCGRADDDLVLELETERNLLAGAGCGSSRRRPDGDHRLTRVRSDDECPRRQNRLLPEAVLERAGHRQLAARCGIDRDPKLAALGRACAIERDRPRPVDRSLHRHCGLLERMVVGRIDGDAQHVVR